MVGDECPSHVARVTTDSPASSTRDAYATYGDGGLPTASNDHLTEGRPRRTVSAPSRRGAATNVPN